MRSRQQTEWSAFRDLSHASHQEPFWQEEVDDSYDFPCLSRAVDVSLQKLRHVTAHGSRAPTLKDESVCSQLENTRKDTWLQRPEGNSRCGSGDVMNPTVEQEMRTVLLLAIHLILHRTGLIIPVMPSLFGFMRREYLAEMLMRGTRVKI